MRKNENQTIFERFYKVRIVSHHLHVVIYSDKLHRGYAIPLMQAVIDGLGNRVYKENREQ